MKNVDLYVFSGTGNTLLVAKFMRDTLQENEIVCRIREIKAGTEVEPGGEERIIGIGFPIACFVTYPVVLDFIERLPEATQNSGLFFFSTMGGSDGHICARLAPEFSAKGYNVLGYRGFIMPSNFMQYREQAEKNREKIDLCQKQAAEFMQDTVIFGKPFTYSGRFFSKLCGLVYTFSFPTGFMNKAFKVKVDPQKCTGCGLCSRSCPAGCITIDAGKAQISKDCQLCMRCVGFCPETALRVHKSLPYSSCSHADFFSSFDK